MSAEPVVGQLQMQLQCCWSSVHSGHLSGPQAGLFWYELFGMSGMYVCLGLAVQ